MYLRKFILIVAGVIVPQLLSSCRTTTKIEVIYPAAITLPKKIDTIALVNRFIPPYPPVESSAFGDGSAFDKQASDSCLVALYRILKRSPRYHDIELNDDAVRGADFYAPPLDPSTITRICSDKHSQALAALEGFVSHSAITTQTVPYQVSYQVPYFVNGQTFYRTEYRTEYNYIANLNVAYSAGFRLYNGTDGKVIDLTRIDKQLNYSKQGSNSDLAISLLPGPDNITAIIANTIADMYAHRISPMPEIDKRCYFTNKSKHFTAAHDSAKIGDWNAAKRIWLDAYTNGKKRQQGIAAFNIALVCEKQDSLDKAMQWAKIAQSIFVKRNNYHEPTARGYIGILDQRIAMRQKLIEQMSK